MHLLRTAFLLLVAFVLRPWAFAAEPPSAPILRIEAGMHTNSISGLVTDASGQRVLTCSHDKTAMLWSLLEDPAEASGFKCTLLRTLRIPMGKEKEGRLYACALTADGRIAAVGGVTGGQWDGSFSVYLFDTGSGRMLRRLTGLHDVAQDLAFSASGHRLAAGLAGDNGIRVWDVASGQLICHDGSYSDSCYGLEWQGDDTLATASWDGNVRLYKDMGKIRPTASGESVHIAPFCQEANQVSKLPFSVRFSPDGRSLVVGYQDTMAVSILSAEDLRLLHQTDPTGHDAHALSSTAWSSDGRHIAAAGQWLQRGQAPIRIWPQAGRGKSQDLWVGCTNTMMDLKPLPGGGFIFATGDPAWGIIQNTQATTAEEAQTLNAPPDMPPLAADGSLPASTDAVGGVYQKSEEGETARAEAQLGTWRSLLLGVPSGADHRMSPPHSQISADASVVAFGYLSFGKVPATFSLTDRSLLLGKTPRSLHLPHVDGMVITDWHNDKNPRLSGEPLPMIHNETSRCIAIAPDASYFVQGSDWSLRCYAADGAKLWEKPSPETVWGVNLSSDGRIIVAFCGDGTLRWYRADNGEEVLAFFPHSDRKRWVLWTPAGWYDCSPDGGEKLIGWHVNHGKDHEADFFPAEKFHDQLYRPDIIDELIRTWDVDAAVQRANARRGSTGGAVAKPQDLAAAQSPPLLELTVGGPTHTLELAADATEATLTYRLRDGSPPMSQMRVLVDGRPVDATVSKPDSVRAEAKVTVPLPAHDCGVALLAGNRHSFSEPALLNIHHRAPDKPAATAPVKKGRLHILAVGVDSFKNQSASPRLPAAKHAEADATAFVSMLAKQTQLYSGIERHMITEEDATAGAIRNAMDRLRTDTQTGDTALVLLAGHGESDRQGRYTYCAYDYDRSRRLHTGVSLEDIQSTLGDAKARVLLFLDAFSPSSPGEDTKVNVAGLVNFLSDSVSNIVVFASNDGLGASPASEKRKLGLFVQTVLDGLSVKTGRITLSTLQTHIDDTLRNQQPPIIRIPQMIPAMTLRLAP